MEHITLSLKVLTPAFLAGADQQAVELRAASVRGLLRWWWRAGQSGDLKTMRENEARLFGSAEYGLKSPLVVKVRATRLAVLSRGEPAPQSGFFATYRRDGREGQADALHYLGYGPIRSLTRDERAEIERTQEACMVSKGQPKEGPVLIRPAIAPGAELEVTLGWRGGTLVEEQVRALVEAAASWVTLGGIGCRSRKGYGALHGSLTAASRDLETHTGHWDAQVELVQRPGPLPEVREVPDWPRLEYLQLSKVGDPSDSWQHALGQLGRHYSNLRPRDPGERWIAGDIDPRRASSVLLTLIEEQGKLQGVIALLPCVKDRSGEGKQAMVRFAERIRGA